MAQATPAKLKSGAWGARVEGRVAPGETITINARSGKTWDARVGKVVWTDGSVSLVSTVSLDRPAGGSAARGRQRRSSGRRHYSSRPARPSTPAPEGPRLTRAQDRDPFEVGDTLPVILSPAEVAEMEARQGFAATDLPDLPGKDPMPDGRRRVAAVVVWAESMSADDVEDLDAWSAKHMGVVRLANRRGGGADR